MKQLLTILCVAFIFTSCSTLKKTISRQNSTTDSIGAKSSATIYIKKSDSSGIAIHNSTEKKTTDSGYTKTTVVKEYYSDEFDFTAEDKASDTTKNSNPQDRTPVNEKDFKPQKHPNRSGGKLLYKETTITETGKIQKNEEKNLQTEESGNKKNVDSSKHDERQALSVSKSNSTTEKSVQKKKFLKGFLLFLFIAFVLCVLYRYWKLVINF